MGRQHTMTEVKKRLWISVENMLDEKRRDEIGLRFNQEPDVWIVRMASAILWPDAPEGGSREQRCPAPNYESCLLRIGGVCDTHPEPPSRHAFVPHRGDERECTAYGKCHSIEPYCLQPQSDPAHLPERQETQAILAIIARHAEKCEVGGHACFEEINREIKALAK